MDLRVLTIHQSFNVTLHTRAKNIFITVAKEIPMTLAKTSARDHMMLHKPGRDEHPTSRQLNHTPSKLPPSHP